jgi:glyoxalase/bleomycin resistance protein/dioxygenase superfamily protein
MHAMEPAVPAPPFVPRAGVGIHAPNDATDSEYAKTVAFYTAILQQLGLTATRGEPPPTTWVRFGHVVTVVADTVITTNADVLLYVDSRKQVDDAYNAAADAGGSQLVAGHEDDTEGQTYYWAQVRDPLGNNVYIISP